MKVVFASLAAVLLLAAAVPPALADTQNGLTVSVSKKTLDRQDQRTGAYWDRIDRTQGLKLSIRNATFKEMPEGEVEWTILVRGYSSSSIQKNHGKEKLKVLKPAEATEMVIGAAQVTGYRDYGAQYKDKIEHQVVITQAGKEVYRMASTAGFDALAKRAVTVNRGN